jgi:signal transduction histidine kinase
LKRGNWGLFNCFLAGWLCLAAGQASVVHAEVVTITEAQATLMPQAQAVTQSTVKLPHRWDIAFPGKNGRAEYLMLLPPIKTQAPHAVCLPRVGNQVEIYLGNQLILKLGLLGNSSTDSAKSPVWVALSANMLSAEHGTPLRVVVDAQASRWGGLTAPLFGPEDEVYPLYRERYVWRQWGAVAVVFSLILMAILASGLWVLQREGVYGYFALGAVFGALRFMDRLIDQPPLPWPLWGAVMAMAFTAHWLLMTRFALALVNLDNAAIRKTFWGLLVVLLSAGAVAFFAGMPWLWTTTLAIGTLPTWIAFVLIARIAWKERRKEAIALCAACFVALATGARDFFAVRVSGDGSGTFSILPVATLLFVLLMGWLIIERHVRQTRAYQSLLASLDDKVRARETELESIYAKLRVEQTNQATLLERQRIMRDIHDGVGAHLVGLISMIRKGTTGREDLQEHASAALDELRMAVDAMQPVNGDIATVLATLRYRLQPRLEAAGIEMDWQVDDLPPQNDLTPHVVLQLQRILLEAFTNVLRHAHATRIAVSARFEDQPTRRLVMEMIDNGIGFSESTKPSAGQGLRSMQARAQAIGADLQITRQTVGGTRVLLSLPST